MGVRGLNVHRHVWFYYVNSSFAFAMLHQKEWEISVWELRRNIER